MGFPATSAFRDPTVPQHNRGMNKLLRILPLLAVLAIGARPAHAETEGGPSRPCASMGLELSGSPQPMHLTGGTCAVMRRNP